MIGRKSNWELRVGQKLENLGFGLIEEIRSPDAVDRSLRVNLVGSLVVAEQRSDARWFEFVHQWKSNENITSFHGKIIFAMPSIESLNGEKVIIEVKGKK